MTGAPHPDHDRGLGFDLSTLASRRRALGLFLGAGAAAALSACTPGTPGTGCGVEIPDETAGPFAGDGPDVLAASGVVRRDITPSFGDSSTVAGGVPLEFTLTLLENSRGCRPLAGAAVYAWHCDRDGRYSLYDPGLENENFLRGVQEADGTGRVRFATIFPGAYSGRWPHIHFEVFGSLKHAAAAGRVLKVSQLALPEAACREVYATAGYETSRRNFPRTALAQDNVFGDDGGARQLAAVSGSAAAGYTAALNVTI